MLTSSCNYSLGSGPIVVATPQGSHYSCQVKQITEIKASNVLIKWGRSFAAVLQAPTFISILPSIPFFTDGKNTNKFNIHYYGLNVPKLLVLCWGTLLFATFVNLLHLSNLSIKVSTVAASNHLIGYPAHQVNANWVQIDAELVNNFRSAQLSRSCFRKLLQSLWRSSMNQHDCHHLKGNFFFSLYGGCMFGNFTPKSWLDLICVSNSYLALTDKITHEVLYTGLYNQTTL